MTNLQQALARIKQIRDENRQKQLEIQSEELTENNPE